MTFLARGPVARAFAVLRDEGPRSFWFKLASELGYRRLLVLERPLTQPIPEVAPRIAVRLEVLAEAQADDYIAFRPQAARARVLARLHGGHRCYVARHADLVVSSCWSATGNASSEYLQCAIDLTVGDAYLFDAFTLPAYRGQRIGLALCMRQLRDLQQAGYRRAIRATVPENVVALRAHARGGFRPVGMIRRFKIGPWQKTFRR